MAVKYHPIATKFWTDEKVERWDDDTRLLALYLLTTPHRSAEGLFRLPKPYIASDLKWSVERLAKPFSQLLADGFLNYDEAVSVMLLNHALKYQAPANPNQETAAIRYLDELPETPLLQEFYLLAQRYAERFAKRLPERYAQSPTLTPTPFTTLAISPDSPPETAAPPAPSPQSGRGKGKGRGKGRRGAPEYTQVFETWWAIYRRKDDKAGAFKSWNALLKEGAITVEELMEATERYMAWRSGQDPQYDLYGKTFLNGKFAEHDYWRNPPPRQGKAQGRFAQPNFNPINEFGS